MTQILIIDDELPTLDMLQLFLEACGYEPLLAANEVEGMRIFEKQRPRIVLTDIKMPGEDGFSVLKKIKAAQPETEVIVITGHGDRDLAQRAFELEASAFLNKPLDTGALDRALKDAEKRLAARDDRSSSG